MQVINVWLVVALLQMVRLTAVRREDTDFQNDAGPSAMLQTTAQEDEASNGTTETWLCYCQASTLLVTWYRFKLATLWHESWKGWYQVDHDIFCDTDGAFKENRAKLQQTLQDFQISTNEQKHKEHTEELQTLKQNLDTFLKQIDDRHAGADQTDKDGTITAEGVQMNIKQEIDDNLKKLDALNEQEQKLIDLIKQLGVAIEGDSLDAVTTALMAANKMDGIPEDLLEDAKRRLNCLQADANILRAIEGISISELDKTLAAGEAIVAGSTLASPRVIEQGKLRLDELNKLKEQVEKFQGDSLKESTQKIETMQAHANTLKTDMESLQKIKLDLGEKATGAMTNGGEMLQANLEIFDTAIAAQAVQSLNSVKDGLTDVLDRLK